MGSNRASAQRITTRVGAMNIRSIIRGQMSDDDCQDCKETGAEVLAAAVVFAAWVYALAVLLDTYVLVAHSWR